MIDVTDPRALLLGIPERLDPDDPRTIRRILFGMNLQGDPIVDKRTYKQALRVWNQKAKRHGLTVRVVDDTMMLVETADDSQSSRKFLRWVYLTGDLPDDPC